MSSNRDVEKGEPDEEERALLGARNEERQDDGQHLNRADDIELAEFEKPGPCSSNIANRHAEAEEPNKFQEPDLSEGSIKSEEKNESEESIDELQRLEPDENFSLIESIYKYGDKELISWLEEYNFAPKACPIPTLRAACQAQSNEEALRMLLDAGVETEKFPLRGTPIHIAAFYNHAKRIIKMLGFRAEGTLDMELGDYWPRIDIFTHTGSSGLVKEEKYEDFNERPNFNGEYVETIRLLCKYGGSFSKVDSKLVEEALFNGSLEALTLLLDAGAPINHRNPEGYTPVHLCVELKLKKHLKVLLAYRRNPEMDLRAVDLTDMEGSTVLHWAAHYVWVEGVNTAMYFGADITVMNSAGDTALHLAAKAGNFDIVQVMIKNLQLGGITNTSLMLILSNKNVEGESPFSYAIVSGNADIVKFMCKLNDDMRYYLHTIKVGDLAPLEYAVEKKFQHLFLLILDLIDLNEDETIRVVKLIAKHNLLELFSELEKKTSQDSFKKILLNNYVLHEAAKHSSREMIIVLLREGADLSQRNKDGQTAISLLMYHMTKPTELMTEILDGCINTDKNIYEKDYVIKINYSVLMPENKYKESDGNNDDADNDHVKIKANDMKVLEALKNTGDVYDQRKLLAHPVVESFLYLKWKKYAKFIYLLISAYVLFLISLNIFIATIYYHMDHKIKEQDVHFIFHPLFWRITAIGTFSIFILVVVLFWLSSITKLPCNKTIWLKLLSSKTKWRRNKSIWLKLFLIVGGALMIYTPMNTADNDIFRGIAVTTVSLSWIYLMILLSWTPRLGYYMQMYGKVSRNVIKVMLSFSFPVLCFSIGFMILLRSKEPFDGPVAAFLKTMVMMTSEFEYENLVKNTKTDCPIDTKNSTLDSLEDKSLTSMYMLRIFFLVFLICVAIVLMYLMLGVAVIDFQELSHDGKQRRLMKQIECIVALEILFQRKPFNLFKFTETETWKIPSEVQVTSDSKTFDRKIMENILNKAQHLKESKDKKADDVVMKAKIDDITNKQSDLGNELLEIRKSVNSISEAVEKRIDKAVDKILEAIANFNEKKSEKNVGQTN